MVPVRAQPYLGRFFADTLDGLCTLLHVRVRERVRTPPAYVTVINRL